MANLIGQHVGQYEITARLGAGGMATVYRARQASMARDVAIKIIKPDLAEMGDFLTRFEREAHTVASLSHPHILKVFDYGHQGDLVYLAMELLKGGSLANVIRMGSLPPDQASRVLDQVASALDYAHKRGIIHRDLKPQNILLDDEGNALLTDFGVAKILSETAGLTQSGVAMGTPSYMSPEQWHGQALDARVDIYALGIMTFEMLTGKLPFVGDTPPTLMYKHLQEPPPPIRELRPDLPPGVEGVIRKALAKNRDQRFSSAGGLSAAFKAALAGQTPVVEDLTNPQPLNVGVQTPLAQPQPTPPGGEATTVLSSRNRSGVWIIGTVIGVLALIGISMVVLSGKITPTATALASLTTQTSVPSQIAAGASVTAMPGQPTATQVSVLSSSTPTIKTATPTSTFTPTAPTLTSTPTSSASPTVDFVDAAQTFDALSTSAVKATNLALTQTQSAVQTATATHWTLTPTPTFTSTPNVTASSAAYLTQRVQTQAAQQAMNQTATATLWTPTPSLTPTLTPTPSNTPNFGVPTHSAPTVTPFPTITIPAKTQQSITATALAAIKLNTTGTIKGQLTWNDKPLSDIRVDLISGDCFGVIIAETASDSSGNYLFDNVPAGQYTIGINGFTSGAGVKPYQSTCYSWPFTLKAGDTAIQDRTLTKADLVVLSPTANAITDATPLIKWQAYPDAAYYQVDLFQRQPSFAQIFLDYETTDTEITSPKTLVSGRTYDGWVIAFNANNVEIATGDIPSFTVR